MHRIALIVCDKQDRAASIINALESEHGIWHVCRMCDAMVFVNHHLPDTIVIDLDMVELEVAELLDAIDARASAKRSVIIGICAKPNQLEESIFKRIDQLASAPAH